MYIMCKALDLGQRFYNHKLPEDILFWGDFPTFNKDDSQQH